MKSKKFDLLLTFGFGLLLFLLIVISYIGVTSLIRTNNTYEKTYSISLKSDKEAQDAYANLIAVHRGMKDVALSKNDKQLKIAIDDVNNYDNKILANFNAIIVIQGKDKILTDIINAYLDWKPIRKKTISFREKGELERSAQNTRTVGAAQVILITKKMNLLLEKFRKNTENSFNNLDKIVNDSISFLLLLAIFAILLGILISIVISRKLLKYRNELHDEKELNRITIDSIGDGVITVDMDRRVVNINKVAQQFTGWNFKNAFNKPFTEVFHITNAETGAKAKDPVEDVISKDDICELENHTILTSVDGVKRHIADSAAPIKDLSNNTIGVVMVFRDVTEQKKHLEEIKYLIYHDGLTGLFNRNYFNKELLRVDDDQYLPLSLIMGDVNGLKLSNDVYGHDIGDALLIKISEILTNNCRTHDIISRLGGDEFSIILPNTSNEEANDILEKIKTACQLCEFTPLNFKPIVLSISLGCSTRTSMNGSIDYILKGAEDRMYTHKLLEGKSVRSTIISSLRNTLLERSCETEKHAVRMTQVAKDIGEMIGLTMHEIDEMKLFTLLHDIGKIGIPDNILNKPGKLTTDEWEEMKKHPEIGYRIAQSTPELAHISELILTHHEHWDGKGYPQGLIGESIPKLSRLLSIIDAYDVMTHDRPYKQKMTQEDAIIEIKRCVGSQFDPNISKIFVEKILKGRWEI